MLECKVGKLSFENILALNGSTSCSSETFLLILGFREFHVNLQLTGTELSLQL